jgi:putative ABC transport system ATP-binding protein
MSNGPNNINGNGGTVLRLEGLHKEFPEPSGVLHVLKGVSLSLHRGEIVMLMGPSGSGKTTMLQIAGCLIRATSGRVEIVGRDLGQSSEYERLRVRRKHLGFVFQSFHLVDALTAYDNVALAQRLRRQPIQRMRIMEILDRLGMTSKAKKLPRDLSGGEKQRIAIARGLIGSPDVLLADEPTSQLDSHSAEAVSELLRQAVKQYNPAVLVSTHDPRLGSIADRILHLRDGQFDE